MNALPQVTHLYGRTPVRKARNLFQNCHFFESVILLMATKSLFLKMCFMIIHAHICCKEIKILYRFYKMTNLTCMCSCVSFEIESIVEAFATYCAKVSLDFAVTFQVTV